MAIVDQRVPMSVAIAGDPSPGHLPGLSPGDSPANPRTSPSTARSNARRDHRELYRIRQQKAREAGYPSYWAYRKAKGWA